MPAKYIFDSNVYIRCILDTEFAREHADRYVRFLPATFFASVVAQELLTGCSNDLAICRVQNLCRPFERLGRVVNPTYTDWKEAALVAVKIARKRPDLASKRIALLNDILIALCCRRIGAVVVTLNVRDFEVIRGVVSFRFTRF
jgi:predicted nucleic acid-binding protein